MDFKNKTVLITGANKGIGFATAKKFLSEGYNVIISGRNEERLKAAKERLGGNTEYILWDVSDISQAPLVMEQAHLFFGNIDTFINNAGIVKDEPGDFFKKTENVVKKTGYIVEKGEHFF